jgi:hypothetical protein
MSVFANDKQDSATSGVNKFQPSMNTVKISLKPEIVGLWGMEINKNQCIEYYNFKSNNELIVKSGKEWSTGFYEYEPMLDMDDQKNILSIHIAYDNNEVDCSGDKVDQTGELSQYNIKWKTPKSIELCSPEPNGECFATLRRVLP